MRTSTEKAKQDKQIHFIMHAANLQIQVNSLFRVKLKQMTSDQTHQTNWSSDWKIRIPGPIPIKNSGQSVTDPPYFKGKISLAEYYYPTLFFFFFLKVHSRCKLKAEVSVCETETDNPLWTEVGCFSFRKRHKLKIQPSI